VVYSLEHWWLAELVERLVQVVLSEAWQEVSLVVHALNEGMSGDTISSNRGADDGTLIILELLWLGYCSSTSLNGLLEDAG
jgi:hypothetical protein